MTFFFSELHSIINKEEKWQHHHHHQKQLQENIPPVSLVIGLLLNRMKLIMSLFLLAAVAFFSTVSAFAPSINKGARSIKSTLHLSETSAAPASTAEQTYVKCGRCQTAYVISEADLGVNGKGRYVI